MKIDVSKGEQTAGLLLSETTTFIMNTIANLQEELENQMKVNVELVQQNADLREKIKTLEEPKV